MSAEFYRNSGVGLALIPTLNELVENGTITKREANDILESFDACAPSVLAETIECQPFLQRHSGKLEGELASYNNLNDLWKIDAKDVSLHSGFRSMDVPETRIFFDLPHQEKRPSKAKK